MRDGCGSRLYYFGTQDEVQIGDRLLIKRWFRQDLFGTVCYIPGISPAHPQLEYEDVKQWAICLDDGTFRVMGYYPESKYGQPSKKFVLQSRGTSGELKPDEKLEEGAEDND